MRITSKVITFVIEFAIALTLVLLACFNETIVSYMKAVLIFIGMLSLVSSMITLISLSIDVYNEMKVEETDDDKNI